MAKVIAYRNDGRASVCQMRFESREKILVSVAGVPVPGIRVMKLLFGLIPCQTIWEVSVSQEADAAHEKLISMLTGRKDSGVEHPLDAMVQKLRPCRSCAEAVWVLRQAAGEAGLE